MKEPKPERECKKPATTPVPPDPLSQRPAPRPGQRWSFSQMQDTAHQTLERVEKGEACFYAVDASEDWFRVLVGNYPPDPVSPTGTSKIPALPNLGLYFWYIPPWYDDTQAAHKEDEAYFVFAGRGQLCVSGQMREMNPGDLVFVPRSTPHRFFTPYEEGLTLLIIFSPAYSGGVHPAPPEDRCRDRDKKKCPDRDDEKCLDWDDGRCRDRDYERKSRAHVERWIKKYKQGSNDSTSST